MRRYRQVLYQTLTYWSGLTVPSQVVIEAEGLARTTASENEQK